MAELVGAAGKPAAGLVTVKYAAYNNTLPVAGMTVAQVREQLKDEWKIAEGSSGYNGKTKLEDNAIVNENTVLTFHRTMGEKGL